MTELREQCSLHLLRFIEVEEFPDDGVDFSDVLGGFASGRCQALCCRKDGARLRVPLCEEDVEETEDAALFDDKGFLVGVCPKHAPVVLARAVDGRACTGEGCAGPPDSDGPVPMQGWFECCLGK